MIRKILMSSTGLKATIFVVILTSFLLWLHNKFFIYAEWPKNMEGAFQYKILRDLLAKSLVPHNLMKCTLLKLEERFDSFGECGLSMKESSNFFCESPLMWNRRKHVYHLQDRMNMQSAQKNDTESLASNIFFHDNWHPNFQCAFERKIGDWGDGGKWICDLNRIASKNSCLIYSLGSSGEFSFETSVHEYLPLCEMHTFDKGVFKCPSPDICQYHSAVMGGGTDQHSKSLQQVMGELKHTGREIDILKMDIEGGEYGVVEAMFSDPDKAIYPRQILVEVHRYTQTKALVNRFMEVLRRHNYVIFHKEPNLRDTCCTEYSFLKLEREFFDKKTVDGNCL